MKYLHDFPDEILCKILEYFNPFDALYSFLNLNHRFNRLLQPFKQQIDFTQISYEHFHYYIETILPIVSKDEPLTVIKLGNKQTPGQIKRFNQLIENENIRYYFKHIDRVLIQSPRLEEFIEFVKQYLLVLSNLQVLSIEIDYIDDKNFQRLTQLILNSILPLPNLVKLSIEMSSGVVLSRLPLDITFHSLVYLNINLSLITDLLILIQRIPNIENLTITISWWTSGDRTLMKMLDEMSSSNNNIQQSYLSRLKKFRLIIHSIITFQFDHLERVLHRILHDQTTIRFSLIVHNALARNDESLKLINGQQWEKLLQSYPNLIQLELFIQISEWMNENEEFIQLNSFNSEYFQKRNWIFAYWRHPIRKQMALYSIPYRNKSVLEVAINTESLLKTIPINYAKYLSIDTITCPFALNFLEKYFPFLEQLHVNYINTHSSLTTSLNLPSLHTLKILKDHVHLPSLFRFFPLINTLSLYFNPSDRSSSSSFENVDQYNQIINLHLTGIAQVNINQLVDYLKQFPNLRYLHLAIQHRRMSNEMLFEHLNDLVQNCRSLINLNIQLENEIEFSIRPENPFNIRTKMKFTDVIFDGILIHLWF